MGLLMLSVATESESSRKHVQGLHFRGEGINNVSCDSDMSSLSKFPGKRSVSPLDRCSGDKRDMLLLKSIQSLA